MQQHLIAIDLDGTTLNDQSKVSYTTIQTLRSLAEMGHLVVIATGRPYRNAIDIYRQIGIHSPMINFNGALCQFPERDRWLASYHQELDKEIAFELLANQEDLDIDLIAVEGQRQLYTTSSNLPDSPFYPKDKSTIKRLSRDSLRHNPTAISIFTAKDKEQSVEAEITRRYGDQVSVRTWGGILPMLEVVHKSINKAVGVNRVAEFYRIPREAILTFGDENNDLEMLEYAGLGVAMQNATEEVKAVADQVTPLTNDQDGLAHFLMDYFQFKI
ncbi:Cof-type HAD-IIB family hydrolase [Hutsoniella sourekii]